jgi:hypothetical protein
MNECFWKSAKQIKVDVESWTEKRRLGRDILSRINPIPLGGVNMFLISGLRPTTAVYISKFKVDLAGNKRQIELGYVMVIITFNLLFKL